MRSLIGTTVLALLATSPSLAACPYSSYSVADEFGRADFVAKVRVHRETWLDEAWQPTQLREPLTFGSVPSGLDPYAGADYSVELLHTFKGRLPRAFTIFSENTTARMPLEVGAEYLVFLRRERQGDEYVRAGALTIDNCGNSGPWAHDRPAVVSIERMARRHR